MHNKPTIQSSHLALRFYQNAGWTEELLNSCLARGGFKFWNDKFEWGDFSYWVLDHEQASRLDVGRLLAICGKVYDYHGALLEGKAAEDYICRMNW